MAPKHKLTFVAQLSKPEAYDGGDLEVMPGAHSLSNNAHRGRYHFPKLSLASSDTCDPRAPPVVGGLGTWNGVSLIGDKAGFGIHVSQHHHSHQRRLSTDHSATALNTNNVSPSIIYPLINASAFGPVNHASSAKASSCLIAPFLSGLTGK